MSLRRAARVGLAAAAAWVSVAGPVFVEGSALAQRPPVGTAQPSVAPGVEPSTPSPPERTPREAAQEAFKRAEAASRELRFQEALEAYEEVGARDPASPLAPVARVRAAELRDHAEGHFEPLAKLEAVRRDPAKNHDRATIEALERDARGFPDGRVRSEALLVASQAYEHAFGEPERALAALEGILTDPAADRGTRALALSEAIGLHRAKGDLRAALGAVRRDPDLLPNLTREVHIEVRRSQIAKGCLGVLAVVALLGVRGGVRAARRLRDVRALVPAVIRPGAIAFAFYIGAGGAVFVRLQGSGDPMPFLLLGAALVAVGAAVRLWSLAEERSTKGLVALRALVGVLGVLAVAYLILWTSNGEYLSPLGL